MAGAAAIILAGGMSSRMGTEKGLVQFCGKPMVEWVVESVVPLTSELIIVANHPGYEQLGYHVVGDDFNAIGPVGGLATGLRHVRAETAFVLGCDMPFLHTHLLAALLGQLGEEGAVAVTHAGQRHPLISVFRKSALPRIVENISADRRRFDQAIAAASGSYWDPAHDLQGFDPQWLRNFNTMEDIQAVDCHRLRQ